MKNTLTDVLFDLDGTITDPFVGISRAVRYALSEMGADGIDDETLRKFIGPPLTYSFSNFCGMTAADADRAVSHYREYYSDNGIFELTVYDGLADALDGLKRQGKRLYVATSKPEPFAVRIIERFYLNKYFVGVCGASFDSSRAEKSDVMKYALARYGIDPSRAAMVGDRKFDMESAKLLGLTAVGVLYGYGSREELETAGADFTVAKPICLSDVLK